MIFFMVGNLDVGDVKISVLSIATVRRDLGGLTEIFPTVDKAELQIAVERAQPDSGGQYLDWSFNSALIRLPNRKILIDTGFGFSGGGPGAGTAQLVSECGVNPQDVDTVVITHGHGDHIGGLTNNGAPAWPAARIILARREFDFWMNGEADRRFGADGTSVQQSAFSICRDQIDCIDMDFPIAESKGTVIRALPAPGHTPGHIGITVVSRGQRLWLLVDTIHALFQMPHPEWSPCFDVDPGLAETTRRDLLKKAARFKVPVHLYHFPFPAVGRVEASERVFAFKPMSL